MNQNLNSLNQRLQSLSLRSDIVMGAFLIAIVFMMILPLPTIVVDAVIALNLCVGVVLLIVSVYMSSPLEFLGFPAVLLLTTLSRLALSISTTRLILLQADAGSIVEGFGNFVVGGNIIVGLVIFLIITIVQFLVITKGSERVAEVSARFSLDGMPGKQMSIDGDLRAGMIDITEAKSRRVKIEKESQLYGAMDGAMKFVKGDAIAGLIIIAVNLLGGIAVGVFQHDMSATEALQQYAILTVGDGLISQIPALFISITAGIIVTRVSQDGGKDLGKDISAQIMSKPQALMTASFILAGFALIPDFPTVTFMTIAAIVFGIGFYQKKKQQMMGAGNANQTQMLEYDEGGGVSDEATDQLKDRLPLVIELARDVKDHLEPHLLDHELIRLRKALYDDLGVVFPGIHLRFSARHHSGHYQILLHDVPVAKGQIQPQQLLVTESTDQLEILSVPYHKGMDFLPHNPSTWVSMEHRPLLEQAGLGFLSATDVMTYHLSLVLKKFAEEFIGIQEAKTILDNVEREYPELVREVQRILPLQRIAEVFKRLVSEDISIRNQRAILESIVEWAPKEKDIVQLVEYVRTDQKRYISHKYSNDHNIIPSYLLDESAEEAVRRSIRMTSAGAFLAMEPEQSTQLLKNLRECVGDLSQSAVKPVLITTMDVRRFVKKLIESELVDLPVLSLQELTQEITVQPLGRVYLDSPVEAELH